MSRIENFSQQEFDRRLHLVEAEMQQRGLDGLVITNVTNLPYVVGDPTGYMTNSGATLGLAAAVVARGEVRLMVRLYEGDSARWKAPSWLVVEPYSGDADDPLNPPDVLAGILDRMGLRRARVGFESDLPGLTVGDLEHLTRLHPELRVVDASDLVVACSVVKSAEEIMVMEQAAHATDASLEAIFTRLAEGVGEFELAAASLGAMLRTGSHYPIFQPFVTSGPRSALAHAVWSDHRIQRDETLFVEISASVLRYHAPAIRTGVVGTCPEAERCYAVCEEAFQAAVAAIRPGAVTGEVDQACRDVIAKAGCAPYFKLRTGYQVGIDWTTRGSVSLMPGGRVELRPNMTFHVRPLLQVAGHFAVGCSETVVVDETGARMLTTYTRRLHRVS